MTCSCREALAVAIGYLDEYVAMDDEAMNPLRKALAKPCGCEDQWSELCEATAALGAAFARFDNARKAYDLLRERQGDLPRAQAKPLRQAGARTRDLCGTGEMTLDWLDDAVEKAKRATPGPWTDWEDRGYFGVCTEDGNGEVTGGILETDAAYIAALSPDRFLALVERVRELERTDA
jgi:hypothetical protein